LKPIRECNREERLERALLALECASMIFDEGFIDSKQFSHDVYIISHAATGRCNNPHENWMKKIEEIEEHGRKHNLYNVEKILSEEGVVKHSLFEALNESS
jgi:hypothetical protein